MAATRVYSTAAYFVAAIVAILLGLVPKFGAIVNATPAGVLGGVTLVLYGMIGLLGAKIWMENQVDFGNPTNLVPIAAGLIIGIGYGTSGFFEVSKDFQLGGIAAGTVVILLGYHIARLVGRGGLHDEGTGISVGTSGVHAGDGDDNRAPRHVDGS
jgi:xanthine/uracil permease